jgi:hypothetical protein
MEKWEMNGSCFSIIHYLLSIFRTIFGVRALLCWIPGLRDFTPISINTFPLTPALSHGGERES